MLIVYALTRTACKCVCAYACVGASAVSVRVCACVNSRIQLFDGDRILEAVAKRAHGAPLLCTLRILLVGYVRRGLRHWRTRT